MTSAVAPAFGPASNFLWFLPTHGDGHYLGTSKGGREVDFGYLRQVAQACLAPLLEGLLAWVFLDQSIAPMQLLGAAIVVGTVMALGLKRR